MDILIKPAYQIGQKVQLKMNKNRMDGINKYLHLFEVQEVATQTCVAGTQVYYYCRGYSVELMNSRSFRHGEILDQVSQKKLGDKIDPKCLGISAVGQLWPGGHNAPSSGYFKYREDELELFDNRLLEDLQGAG